MDNQNLFEEIPDNFFSPLAARNRHHYSRLLLIYYQLFVEYHSGIERELVISRFEEYFTDEIRTNEIDMDEESPEESAETLTPRAIASLFLRKLIMYGWISEEVLADYTQIINMCAWARPFFSAIAETVKGVSVEYESHVVGIYSSLCSDAVQDNGHHAVLNALDHTRRLIESLKILSQNIKTHIENMFHFDSEVRDLLHIHYDLYMNEIVDKAYNRLKTSDNLSKYRPTIISAVNNCLQDDVWIEKSAVKLGSIKNIPKEDSRRMMIAILKEIRDELKNIDPILEEIDDKNRQYSRISTEKIKAHLYADASLHGKIQGIINGLRAQSDMRDLVSNRLIRVSFLNRGSLYTRPRVHDSQIVIKKPDTDDLELELLETEMVMKIQNQLNPEKIAAFLDEKCATDGSPTPAETIIEGMKDFIRIVYAALYCESRGEGFPYRIQWEEQLIQKQRFVFKRHSFIRAHRNIE